MTKEQISQIIGIVLSTVIALMSVWGYNVAVIQPQQQAVIEQVQAAASTAAAACK